MEKTYLQWDRADLQEVLKKIRGVLYAQVVEDDRGTIDEIHIVSNMSRSPKQVARDIESLLFARFQIRVDHKKISVAQMEITSESPARAESRLSLEGFGMSIEKNKINCTVTLSHDGVKYQGVSEGLLDSQARTRGMVVATLNAVHQFLGRDDVFSLAEYKTISINDASVIMVCVHVTTALYSTMLVGTAQAEDDMLRAVVKATLSATNRKISLIQ